MSVTPVWRPKDGGGDLDFPSGYGGLFSRNSGLNCGSEFWRCCAILSAAGLSGYGSCDEGPLPGKVGLRGEGRAANCSAWAGEGLLLLIRRGCIIAEPDIGEVDVC